MTTYAQIITAMNSLLAGEYPSIRRYGNDTVDQAIPPYFFVECVPLGLDYESRNMLHKSCTVKITYVQRVPDQVDNLTKVEAIRELVGMVFRPNTATDNRRLLVQEYTHDYIGENDNILQISFRLDWYESTESHEGDLIETVETVYTQEGDA